MTTLGRFVPDPAPLDIAVALWPLIEAGFTVEWAVRSGSAWVAQTRVEPHLSKPRAIPLTPRRRAAILAAEGVIVRQRAWGYFDDSDHVAGHAAAWWRDKVAERLGYVPRWSRPVVREIERVLGLPPGGCSMSDCDRLRVAVAQMSRTELRQLVWTLVTLKIASLEHG